MDGGAAVGIHVVERGPCGRLDYITFSIYED